MTAADMQLHSVLVLQQSAIVTKGLAVVGCWFGIPAAGSGA